MAGRLVDLGTVDPIFFDKTYYLGPRAGGTATSTRCCSKPSPKPTGLASPPSSCAATSTSSQLQADEALGSLTLRTLHWTDEIREPRQEIPDLPGAVKVWLRSAPLIRGTIRSRGPRSAESRGWGRNIRFAVSRGLAVVLTGHVEGDVIRHTEIFAPLEVLDLPVGHIVTVLEEMGIFEDDSEPSFERWLVGCLEGLAPGIRSEAERMPPRPARRRPPQPPTQGRHGLALAPAGPSGRAGVVEPLRLAAGSDSRRRPRLYQDAVRSSAA
ncbi:hypothetical protein ACIA6C_15015 [Streptomyces sp. NPDC051578]|uniref:hypothetical protein n=1 Tax=Streptomyces sp. NPDC051578 TaxID=3365662 RepID=UPI0037B2E851